VKQWINKNPTIDFSAAIVHHRAQLHFAKNHSTKHRAEQIKRQKINLNVAKNYSKSKITLNPEMKTVVKQNELDNPTNEP